MRSLLFSQRFQSAQAMKVFLSLVTAVSALTMSSSVLAQGSMLRIGCDGNDVGAEVSVNGNFKGECPLDMQVQAGSLTLRVVKKIDTSRVRVFEQEVRVGDGIVKRIDVVLGAPQLTPEGRNLENERILREQIAAQARENERRKAMNEAIVALDKHVDELLRSKRMRRTVQTPECPDCPPMILPPGGSPKRPTLPTLSDPELEGWMRSIERELAAYLDNPQENFRLPTQVQAWHCEGAEANIRRIVGLINLADETPKNRDAYRVAMKSLGAGESMYYFRDVRIWPVQMACKNGNLDGPVDVWIFSMVVSDNPHHLSATPRLTHLRFTAANGEPVGPLHHVDRRGDSVTEYKDAATNKMMQSRGVAEFETMSFSYNHTASAGNPRSVTVVYSTFANSTYQNGNPGASTFATFALGGGRTETLQYQGQRLAARVSQKDGRNHGPTVVYAQAIKTGPLIPDIKTAETVTCFHEGVVIQANLCSVQ